ncbi:alpha/beta hydrolase [Kribbella catacumbae]|uniref:alpha/beta hydrolase n=1 Tax=Kribbella catacumbae TaxID=460086 RepID=UPI0003748643|nr:alpha/beta hydrolase [Kribbella catacumbae]
MNHAVRKHALAIVLAVLGATTLAACTTPAASRSGSGRPKAGAGPADPATRPELRPFYQQKLKWKACGEIQCAELTVPMDYTHPANGKTFVLPVARAVTAKPAERIGSIIANPGGPGSSGATSLLEDGMTDSFGAKARARFDIVSFDPRGVGGSSPALTCGGSEEAADETTEPAPEERAQQTREAVDPFFPKTDGERADVLEAAKQEADACAKHSAGILRHVGTEDVARDMDVLRAALGEPQVTYLGWSYGTSLGTSYAEQFPRRVRAMVLDGAVDSSLDWSKRAVSQGVGFQRAVEDYATHCADVAGDSCPGSTPEEIRTLMDRLFEKTAREPLPVTGEEFGLDANALLGAVVMSMYAPETQWQDLSEALAAADRGDATKLATLAESEEPVPDGPSDAGEPGTEVPSDNSDAALQAVNCFDNPHPRDPQAYWQALAPAQKAAGRYGTSNVTTALICKDWPRTAQKPHRVSATGVAPVLVVGTTGDAATPYEEAASLASQFPGGMLLTYEGLGHTAYGRSNACVTNHVDDYLIERKTVPSGATC